MKFAPTALALAVVTAIVAPQFAHANADAATQNLPAEAENDTAVASQSQQPIEKMVITSSRMAKPVSAIPNTVTVIDQETLQQQLAASRDLSTIIGNLAPGFSPSRQKMSNTGETLRGRAPLIMIDGVPQSNPLRSGGRSGQTIDPDMIERIEIIHGANALHGLGAQGGIINYITKKPDDSGHKLSLDVSAPTDLSHDSLSFGANYSFSGSSGALDMLGSVGYHSSGVYYDANGDVIGVDTTQGESMDSQSKDLFLKFGYDMDDSRLELMINHFRMNNNGNWMAVKGSVANDIPTSAVEQSQPWDAANNRVTTSSLVYKHNDIGGQQLEMQLFNQNFQAVYGGGCFASFYDPEFDSAPGLTTCSTTNKGENLYYEQSRNRSNKWGLKTSLLANDLLGFGVDLAYGLDLFSDTTEQDLVQTGVSWVPETRYDNIAPFAQLSFEPLPQLALSAGIRQEFATLKVDDYKTLWGAGNKQVAGGEPDFSQTLFNLGASYNLTPALRVYSSYSQGFGMADIGRLLRDGNSFPAENASVDGAINLEPVLTDNYELGIDYQGEYFTAKLAGFHSGSDMGARLELNQDGIYSVKREKSIIRGIEASLNAYVGDADTLGLNMALTEGRYDANQDGRTDTDLDGANIAPNRVNLYWEHEFSFEATSRIQLNYFMDREFHKADGSEYANFDGYYTVDASFTVPLYGGSLSVGLQNLLNEDYYTYYSQTMPNDTRNFKGMGRTVSLGYSLPF
ncbi:TonB-dependent receptor [Shewanella sp. JM162201]|uniref:TonB-dependent receptor n=1 Tax=Shewanella jiangmenensis TaxID=2837387 RepID=A0ABS5V3P8_9GAMM|nr:TonB-dependent receptor [Shewanella jiangmenensis]MBT1443683.1 TonB-dependent receptor [Shewanella jiangmenensis]